MSRPKPTVILENINNKELRNTLNKLIEAYNAKNN